MHLCTIFKEIVLEKWCSQSTEENPSLLNSSDRPAWKLFLTWHRYCYSGCVVIFEGDSLPLCTTWQEHSADHPSIAFQLKSSNNCATAKPVHNQRLAQLLLASLPTSHLQAPLSIVLIFYTHPSPVQKHQGKSKSDLSSTNSPYPNLEQPWHSSNCSLHAATHRGLHGRWISLQIS